LRAVADNESVSQLQTVLGLLTARCCRAVTQSSRGGSGWWDPRGQIGVNLG